MRLINTNLLNYFYKKGVKPVKDKIDVLDTKEEIQANTDAEKMAGALAVKEMYSELNSNLAEITKTTKVNVTRGTKFSSVGEAECHTRNKICYVTIESIVSSAVANGDIVLTGLPKPAGSFIYLSLQLANGYSYSARIKNGNLEIYYPTYTDAGRIDTAFCYITE